MSRERALAIALIVVVVSAYLVLTWESEASPVTYYAKYVRSPLPSQPQALHPSSNLKIELSAPPDAFNWTVRIVNLEDMSSYMLPVVSTSYNDSLSLWTINAMIPANSSSSTYNVIVGYQSGEKYTLLESPRSLWIIREDLDQLNILVCGDIKTPNPKSAAYWRELVRESNLIDPDMLVLLGDLVERPTMASGWLMWEQYFIQLLDPIYVVIGNHDYEGPGSARIYQKVVGPRRYNVTIGNFLFVALDSQMEGYITMEELNWLDNVLRANADKVKIIGFHHSIFAPNKKLELRRLSLNSIEDVEAWAKSGYIYSSWAEHLDELERLIWIIVEHDVRLILYEHIHQDMNVIVEDWRGNLHYFVSPAALAYDIRGTPDYRGFKLIRIHSNGTLDEHSLYYNGTGLHEYPNSIPIDSGVTIEGKEKIPHILGYIDYNVFTGENASSINVYNRLNITLANPRILLSLKGAEDSSKIELKAWEEVGGTVRKLKVVNYTITRTANMTRVIVSGVNVLPQHRLWVVAYTDQDRVPPKIEVSKIPESMSPGSWTSFTVKVLDQGWGPGRLLLSISGPPGIIADKVVDLVDYTDKTVTYKVWIKAPRTNCTLTVKVKAVDVAGNVSEEIARHVTVGSPQEPTATKTEPEPAPSPSTTPTTKASETTSTPVYTPSEEPLTTTTKAGRSSNTPVETEKPRASTATSIILIVAGVVLIVLALAIKRRSSRR